MIDILNVQRSIDLLKDELLDSIKERIIEIGKGATIQLYPISVTDGAAHARGMRNTMEIRNIYVSDDEVPCGDFACYNDSNELGVAFGRSLEGFFVEDLYKILFSLHGRGWQVEAPGDSSTAKDRYAKGKKGIMQREIWKNKLQRKGA